jgi:hypothetical protein
MTPQTKAAVKILLDTPQTQAAHTLCLSVAPQETPPAYMDWLEYLCDTADVTTVEDKDVSEVDYNNAVLEEVKAWVVVRVNYSLQNY